MSWKFWKKTPKTTLTEAEEEAAYNVWYDKKTTLLEKAMGKEHDMVIHALISYEVGGALHDYLYPNGIDGTGVASKQLARWDGSGSSNKHYDQYELIMFTREDLTVSNLLSSDEDTAPQIEFKKIRTLMNTIAPYSEQATLNQYETIGFPEDMEHVAGRFVIMDCYKPECFEKKFGLMLLIEIFESEFNYKQKHGGDALIKKLIKQGHYPYSDLNRAPVV